MLSCAAGAAGTFAALAEEADAVLLKPLADDFADDLEAVFSEDLEPDLLAPLPEAAIEGTAAGALPIVSSTS